MMPLWTILSDDLTGLQAIAGEFARLGFRVGTGTSRVPAREALENFEIYGFDTATRSLSGAEAERRVFDAARQLVAAGADRIFKHNDSILQGHVALELRAVAKAVARDGQPIVYAPACPNRRRVTRGAIQLEVDAQGRALEGGLRKDLRRVFEHCTGLATGLLDLATLRSGAGVPAPAGASCDILLADAESDQDLDRIASASLQAGCHVLSGSVGLAAALARASLPQRRFASPVLVLAGSQQAATRMQVERLLARSDCAGFALGALAGDRPEHLSALVQRLRQALVQGMHCVIWTPGAPPSTAPAGGYPTLADDALARLRSHFGAVLRAALQQPAPPLGGLVAAGGMTADLVLREVLGVSSFAGLGWLCEGMTVAVAQDGAYPGLRVVTKSGGWGPADALSDAVDRCAGWHSPDLLSPLSPQIPPRLESIA